MSDFYNIAQDDINVDVNSYTQTVSIMALLPTPLDAKLCNWFQIINSIKVETIVEYLDRLKLITDGYRSAGVPVTVLIPKTEYEADFITCDGTYVIADFSAALTNFDIKYYTFIGGLADENFVEILQSSDRTRVPYTTTETPNIADYSIYSAKYGQDVQADLYFTNENGNTSKHSAQPEFVLVDDLIVSINFGNIGETLSGYILLS